MDKGYLLERLTWPMAKKAFEDTSFVVIRLVQLNSTVLPFLLGPIS